MTDTPCIAGFRDEGPTMTVAEYNAIQRQRDDRPLWARFAPPVEALTEEPADWDLRITDPSVYRAQMLQLVGLGGSAAPRTNEVPGAPQKTSHA